MLRWVAVLLLLLLVGLQVMLWSRHGGMPEVNSLRVAVKKQSDEDARLLQRNQALEADVHDLKHGDEAIEARARAELGLIKPGETFYQVIPRSAASAAVPPVDDGTGGH